MATGRTTGDCWSCGKKNVGLVCDADWFSSSNDDGELAILVCEPCRDRREQIGLSYDRYGTQLVAHPPMDPMRDKAGDTGPYVTIPDHRIRKWLRAAGGS